MYARDAGFDAYVCDEVERGHFRWLLYPKIFKGAPIFRTLNESWSFFRFGDANGHTHVIWH